MARRNGGRRNESEAVAVAIDKDKGSQHAMKWAMDHLMSRGQSITLLHVKTKPSSIPNPSGSHVKISDVNDQVAQAYKQQVESQAKEVFLPFRCFCSRKNIKCNEVILEDTDIAKALIDYVSSAAIETLVLGAPSRGGFVRRFRTAEVTTSVSKGAPDYCTVYVIGKGKISSVRSASAPPPPRPQPQLQLTQAPPAPALAINPRYRAPQRPINPHRNLYEDTEIRSPFTRERYPIKYEPSIPESDISSLSSGRPSSDTMFSFPSDMIELASPQILSSSDYENRSTGSSYSGDMSMDFSSRYGFSSCSEESGRTSWSSHMDDAEAEMRRLKQELKQTMDMYSVANREALSAKKMAIQLQSWKMQEEQKKEETRLAGEAALSLAEMEKAKCKVTIEAAQATQRIAKLEAQKRMNIERKASIDAEEMTTTLNSFGHRLRYRKYTIEEIKTATENFSPSRKIGEGGYGPVYHCNLDHTPVAIKVLRPDATQGQSQFQQEVEVLSCIRHPNMVLLLGACPEYGCLVYEYMANGSLEDRLFRHNNTPIIPWQVRFRIAAEIATCLLFLHQTKPKPLVHRDLKPANILLDHNYVSKISDVGLARLVPPSVANSVSQYSMTSTAGTFCYIDPEYQQTGMLGLKSDVYSLGIVLLQIITAKPPIGLTHHVENAIENGNFAEILDPAVTDWPVEEALIFAKLALKCSELRRRDRPDLGQVVLPQLKKLRDLAESNMPFITLGGSTWTSPIWI
ncbi:hypothetical protein like AT2G24370 [Hibiscus trionum]|uniref:RING-type E3 ubiquitin transferase n=1 Tax=Hibiscus trionum TaxID=183268 RepID=A0A9W7LZZ3_HIBTR|nr:hypothetical protein like AT2G24370 [Hibiscus trionum]